MPARFVKLASCPEAQMLLDRFSYLTDAVPSLWLAKAISELGGAEVAGKKANPRILDYRTLGKAPFGGDDGEVRHHPGGAAPGGCS